MIIERRCPRQDGLAVACLRDNTKKKKALLYMIFLEIKLTMQFICCHFQDVPDGWRPDMV